MVAYMQYALVEIQLTSVLPKEAHTQYGIFSDTGHAEWDIQVDSSQAA